MQICTKRMWREPGSSRRVSLKERTEQCRQKLKLSKLAVGTTHPNTLIPDEYRMEQQIWSSGYNTGDIMPPTSSFAPSFSVCPFWLLSASFVVPPFSPNSSGTSHPTQAVTLLPQHAAFPDLHRVLPVTPTSHSHELSSLMHLHVTTVRESWNLISCSPHSEEHSFSFLIPDEHRERWSNFTDK